MSPSVVVVTDVLVEHQKVTSLCLDFQQSITFCHISPNFVDSHPVFKELGILPLKTDYYNDNQTAAILLQSSDAWGFLPDKAIGTGQKSDLTTVSIPGQWHAPYSICLVKRKHYQEIFAPLESELLRLIGTSNTDK